MISREYSGTPLFRYRSEFFDCSFFRAPATSTTVLFQISSRIFHAVERNTIKRRIRAWCRTRRDPSFQRIRVRVLKKFDARDRRLWKAFFEELDSFLSKAVRI